MPMTISPADMKQLETEYMKAYAMPGALLMEHAAQGVVAAMERHAPAGSRALFLCGPGNNGGDGYAAARLWQARGGASVIWEMTDHPAGDAGLNRRLAADAGIPIYPLPDAQADFAGFAVIVDALFGTGLTHAITEPAAKIIRCANGSALPIVAVDIPSGLDGNTGCALGDTIRATETVTFHRIKTGLLLQDAPDYTGTVTVQPILIPEDYGDFAGLTCMDERDLRRWQRLFTPAATAHKGTMGSVLIFAGSYGMAGAAAMCARAAIRSGAGLTRLVLHDASLLPILQTLVPEATCTVLTSADPLSVSYLKDLLKQADAAVVGPGLGRSELAEHLLKPFLDADVPTVWDADALNLLARRPATLPPAAIATPHPGEAARLLHRPVAEILADPLQALHDLHLTLDCTVLLKGARPLMTDGRSAAVLPFGSPVMAQGGSGDKLAGIIAALCARRVDVPVLELVQYAAAVHQLDFRPEHAPHIP